MSEVISSVLKKNGTDLFMITDSSIVKLVPIARVKKVEEEFFKIKDSCDRNNIIDLRAKLDHLSKLDSVLKQKGTIVYGGIVYQVNSFLKTSIFDEKVTDVVKKKLKEERGKNPEVKAQEIFYALQNMLLSSEESEGIGQADFMRERIFFTLAKTPSDVVPNIYCAKYIPSFRIRYEGTSVKGVWEFPELVVGTRIIESRASAGEEMLFSFDDQPHVLRPSGYKHPYVFIHDNRICIGSFFNSTQLATIKRESFINSLFKFMCQVESIITNGYYEGTTPANGQLNAAHFRSNKIFNSIEEEEKDTIEKAVARIKSESAVAKRAHERQIEGASRRTQEMLDQQRQLHTRRR